MAKYIMTIPLFCTFFFPSHCDRARRKRFFKKKKKTKTIIRFHLILNLLNIKLLKNDSCDAWRWMKRTKNIKRLQVHLLYLNHKTDLTWIEWNNTSKMFYCAFETVFSYQDEWKMKLLRSWKRILMTTQKNPAT